MLTSARASARGRGSGAVVCARREAGDPVVAVRGRLKGFAKIELAPGETKTVQFTIKPRDLAYFDVPGHQWKANAGEYEIQVGASSRDVKLKKSVRLTADFMQSAAVVRRESALPCRGERMII